MKRRILAAALLLGGLGGGFLAFADQVARFETAPAQEADGVVVVTGGTDRITVGAQLVGPGHARRLLVSGVNDRVTPDDMAQRIPVLRPILGCCVDLGYRARNTIGNALETRDWARRNGYRSVVLVTDASHMPRAAAEFANAMPGIRIAPHVTGSDRLDRAGWWSDVNLMRALLSEYARYLIAIARMRLEPEPGAWFPGSLREGEAQPVLSR